MSTRLACAVALLVVVAGPSAQDPPTNDDRREEQLTEYLRTGRYADARELIDRMLRDEPREDLENVRAVFAIGPNMRIRQAPATFACAVSDTGVRLPVTVDGTRVEWLLDTGANISIISDAEAKRLGLAVRDSGGRAGDLAGGTVPARMAVARRVVIGGTELDEVSMLVTPAGQMPWTELPPGRQGIIGLPLAIALEAVQWSRQGTCRTGSDVPSESAVAGASNRIVYDQLHVITTVAFENRTLEFLLDTGNQAGTQLWERFGKDFPTLLAERGTRGSVRVTQMGGATEREVVTIPDVRLTAGGMPARLERAHVFSKPVGDDRFHGLLGMDVLSQAREVTLDFRSMTLTLR